MTKRLASGLCKLAAPAFLYAAGIALAAVGAWLAGSGRLAAGIPVLAATIVLVGVTHRRGGRLTAQARRDQGLAAVHLATIEALALAIDAKDQTTQRTSAACSCSPRALARAVGMTEDEIQGVKTAALLHDIGKLAVPEHILSKPGPLTDEEFQKIRIHPQVGAEIIERVPFPYPVAPLILSHHERWDGKGYPLGLHGEEIPLGARILSVVDYFDALTSRAPVPQGVISRELAVALLQQEAGKALDPSLVATFLDLLPGAAVRGRRHRAGARRRVQDPVPAPVARQPGLRDGRAVAPSRTSRSRTARSTRCTRSRRRWARASAWRTRWRSSSSKLRTLVPFSCCALFLRRRRTETLRCRFATGVDADDDPARVGARRATASPAGSRATGGRSSTRGPRADFEAAGPGRRPAAPAVRARVPAGLQRPLHRHAAVYHVDADVLHATTIAGCSTASPSRPPPSSTTRSCSSRRRRTSLTDPLTGLPNTRFMFMHLTRELARAERLQARGVAARDGPRRLQGDQRHLRPPRRRPRAARGGAGAARRRSGRTTSASATPATSSSSCSSGCGAEEAEHKRAGAAAGDRRGVRSRRGRASGCSCQRQRRRGRLPAGRRDLRGAAGHGRQPDVSRQDRRASGYRSRPCSQPPASRRSSPKAGRRKRWR